MRIWDINPGYLNSQSLLGEHRELHAIISVITGNKKGYSKHPETLRWVNYLWALKQRHSLLCCEMKLRGYNEKSPILINPKININKYPDVYIDSPAIQFKILSNKYLNKKQGRIPLPKNMQQLWSQYKYSIMARDINLYKYIGKAISCNKCDLTFSKLANLLTKKINTSPNKNGIVNALQHMWGYVKKYNNDDSIKVNELGLTALLMIIQKKSFDYKVMYLIHSTALSDLASWKFSF